MIAPWLLLLLPAAATGASSNGLCREQDELWMVSTFGLSCPEVNWQSGDTPTFRRYQAGRWVEHSLAEFEQSVPDQLCLLYVHGNRVETADAIRRARMVYQRCLEFSEQLQPVRLVIYNWPAAKIRGQVRDFRTKAARADLECKHMACLLQHIRQPTSIVGYSFGGRIATGALHLYAGGSLDGFQLPPSQDSKRLRLAVLAGAMNHDWLLEGRRYGEATRVLDSFLALNNSRDPVLKRYRFISSCANPLALGFVGARTDDHLCQKFTQLDVSSTVGKSHREERYYESSRLAATLVGSLLPDALTLTP